MPRNWASYDEAYNEGVSVGVNKGWKAAAESQELRKWAVEQARAFGTATLLARAEQILAWVTDTEKVDGRL